MVPFAAFLLTVLMEWAVFAWFSRLGFARTGVFCLCLNGTTWGAAMGVLNLWRVPVSLLEIAIFLVEAALIAWFWAWRPGRALLASLLMNLTSWWLGTLLIELAFYRR